MKRIHFWKLLLFVPVTAAAVSEETSKNCIRLLNEHEPESFAIGRRENMEYQNFTQFRERAPGNLHIIDPKYIRSQGTAKTQQGDQGWVEISFEPSHAYGRELPSPALGGPKSVGLDRRLENPASQSVATVATLHLSTWGEGRYFWYQPRGSSAPVPARVLDLNFLHERGKLKGLTILAESIVGVDEAGARVRSVGEIQADELRTLRRDVFGFGSEEAEFEFASCLTPVQVATRKLAASLQMKLYGYSHALRSAADDNTIFDDRSAYTTLQSSFGLIADYCHNTIERTFGSYSFLKTEEELKGRANPYLIFSRLDPRFVLDRFETKELQYGWVILEDGRLIVMPMMPHGANLKPQILPLAVGRKVYSGGMFSIQSDGKLSIRMNSNGYQSIEGGEFGSGGPDIEKLVSAVFEVQAGRKVANLGTDPFPWERTRPRTEADDAFDRFMKFSAGKATSGPAPREEVAWNPEKDLPLNFDEWKKRVDLPERDLSPHSKSRWANYVLRTSDRMKFEDIKKSYRKLSKRFHSDRSKDQGADEVQKILNLAWEIIREQMR